MKKYTLIGHIFELDDRAALFLERYVERIEEYAQKYNITSDVLEDIKYGIVEKLYRFEKPITEKNVMEVANTLGEPEDIFEGTPETVWEKKEEFKDKRLTSFIGRDRPIIWGVAYWIAKTLNLPVIFVRIVFLVAIFIYGIGIWAYLILALFAPYKEKQKTTGKVWNLFFEIVRALFWIVMVWFLGVGVAGMTWLLGFTLFTPSLENQSLTMRIPQYLYVFWILTFLAFCILFAGAIGALLKKNWINKTRALASVWIIFISGVVLGGTIYRKVLWVANTASLNMHEVQNVVLPIAANSWDSNTTTGVLHIDIQWPDRRSYWPWIFGGFQGDAFLTVEPSETNEVVVTESVRMMAPTQQQYEKNKTALNPLVVSWSDRWVLIKIPTLSFTEEVPFAGLERQIVISIPKDITFSIDSSNVLWRWQINNLHRTQYKTENGKKYIWYCRGNTTYHYDDLTQQYICDKMDRHAMNGETQDRPSYDEEFEELQEEIQEAVNEYQEINYSLN